MKIGQVSMKGKMFALSIVGTQKEGGGCNLRHFASLINADSKEAAADIGLEKARESWSEEEGWEHSVAANEVSLTAREEESR